MLHKRRVRGTQHHLTCVVRASVFIIFKWTLKASRRASPKMVPKVDSNNNCSGSIANVKAGAVHCH
jgi:hypothetical protein